MAKPLYIEDLNKLICDDPGCTNDHKEGLVLNSKCHTGKGTISWYSHGILTITCAVCEAVVAKIAVASNININ